MILISLRSHRKFPYNSIFLTAVDIAKELAGRILSLYKVGNRSGQSRHEVMHMVPGHSQGTFVGGSRAIAAKVDTEPGSLATPEKKVTGSRKKSPEGI